MEAKLHDTKSILRWLIENKPQAEKAFILSHPPNYLVCFEESVRFLSIPSKRKRYIQEYAYSPALSSLQLNSASICHEIPSDILYRCISPSGKAEFLLRKCPGNSTECIEIWKNGVPVQVKDLAGYMKDVYRNAIWGNFSWSKDETLICFVAEKKESEKPYLWDTKDTVGVMESMTKFEHSEDFGEQMKNRKNPTLFVYSVLENEIKEIPLPLELDVFPSYPLFDDKTGLIFVGIHKQPHPRGIVGFTKPSALYFIRDIHKSPTEVIKLSKTEFVCLSPHFTPDYSQLFYFSIPDPVLTHSSCFDLRSLAWPFAPGSSPNILVPIVESPKEKHGFPGIFGYQGTFHSNACGFICDSKYFIFNSFAYGMLRVYLLNMETKELKVIEELPQDNNAIMAICNDFAVVRSSGVNILPYYSLVKMKEGKVEVLAFGQHAKMMDPASDKILGKLSKISKKIVEYGKAEGYLYGDFEGEPKKQPLLVLLHGGPHSNFAEVYFNHVGMYLAQGYVALIINYRASIGYGKEMLEGALGSIGERDVEDVYNITKNALKEYSELLDEKNVFMAGYSFGGFLTSWILAKYPKFVRAAVVKNPACNLVDTLHCVDIPSWAYAEALNSPMKMTPTKEDFMEFFARSPLYSADKIIDPVLVMVGEKDGRIPCCSGIQLYNVLRNKGTPTKLLYFPEDNHSLSSPDADENGGLNALIWFETFLK